MSELITVLVTAGLGLLSGAVLALLGSRQRLEVEYDIELRGRRIEAYQALWKIVEPLAYYAPPTAVTHAVARELAQDLRRWYFEVGGLFLSELSREAYFDLQKGLGGVIKDPRDGDQVPVGEHRFERLRGAASRLRTTLARDVATRVNPRRDEPLLRRIRRGLSGLLPSIRRGSRLHDPVELSVHRGWLWGEQEQECYSVLVQNPLASPTVQLERLYFDTTPALPLLPGPIRLGPGGHWEMAVPADKLPPGSGDPRWLVRAELSDHTVLESKPGNDVEPHPDFLFVAKGARG